MYKRQGLGAGSTKGAVTAYCSLRVGADQYTYLPPGLFTRVPLHYIFILQSSPPRPCFVTGSDLRNLAAHSDVQVCGVFCYLVCCLRYRYVFAFPGDMSVVWTFDVSRVLYGYV